MLLAGFEQVELMHGWASCLVEIALVLSGLKLYVVARDDLFVQLFLLRWGRLLRVSSGFAELFGLRGCLLKMSIAIF